MRETEVRSLFAKSRKDSRDIDRALREAKEAKSKASVFSFLGREFLLLQSLDDLSWSYRPLGE